MSETVTLARHGQVAVITIDNPPVNALSHAVRKGISDCLAEAAGDDGIKAVIIYCAGRTFIAGADIREFGKPPQGPSLREVLAQLDAFRKPTVAAIHGTALGGGLETALPAPSAFRRSGFACCGITFEEGRTMSNGHASLTFPCPPFALKR